MVISFILLKRRMPNVMRKASIFMALLLGSIFLIVTFSYADECFNSSRKLTVDAQTIRLKAMEMNWKVGKSASIAAASIATGKTGIYPRDNVEICLREEDDSLQIRMQSKSKDASKAHWHKVTAKKIATQI